MTIKIGRLKRLTKEADLLEYIEKASEWIGVKFPIEYLQDQVVYALLDSKGCIKGGFCYILNGPFRVIQGLPDKYRHKYEELYPSEKKEVFEITGLWLDPSFRGSLGSIFLWLKMYWEAVKSCRKYYIYAYSSNKNKLKNIYKICNPQLIYEGNPKKLKGMGTVESERVEIAKVISMHKVFFLKPIFFFKRLKKFKKFKFFIDYKA